MKLGSKFFEQKYFAELNHLLFLILHCIQINQDQLDLSISERKFASLIMDSKLHAQQQKLNEK